MHHTPLTPDTARRASQSYIAIKAAGMLPELEHSLREALAVARSRRWLPSGHANPDFDFDAHTRGNGWELRGIEADAERLAELLQCDPADVLPWLFEAAWQRPTTRGVALEVLAQVAAEARKQASKYRRAS